MREECPRFGGVCVAAEEDCGGGGGSSSSSSSSRSSEEKGFGVGVEAGADRRDCLCRCRRKIWSLFFPLKKKTA